MTVTPLTHDQGTRPCNQVAQYASDEWLERATEMGLSFQCLGCERVLTMANVTAGEPEEG